MTEIGMKGTFMDGRLRLNAAYYDYTFDGFQTKWDNVIARELLLEESWWLDSSSRRYF